MEVRARNNNSVCNGNNNNLTMEELLEKNKKKMAADPVPSSASQSGLLSRARSELGELGRAALRLLKGEGSLLAYLLIPALITMLWLLVCMLTTRAPSMSLEQRLSQKYLRVRRKTRSKTCAT